MNNSEKRHLIDRIREAQGLTDKEKTDLINFLNESKTYGLVWENKTEDIEEKLREELPVLVERNDEKIKPIISKDPNAPNHIIIEGDNLAALTDLSYTHAGKIDVIYIDPPYNTGNKDFIYNDSYVDKEDSYRHSKWLSFMNRRLKIAKKLLSERGVIFISIDDNEVGNLTLLCNDKDLFGEQNHVTTICRQVIKGGSRAANIKTVHDYVLVYSKRFDSMNPFTGEEKEQITLDLSDGKGSYTKGRELNKWGAGSRREDSPSMWYPIPGPDGKEVFPIRNDGSEGRWRWGKKKLLKAVSENDVIFEKRNNGTYVVYEKVRAQKSTNKQFTSWFNDDYINAKGSEAVKSIFNTLMSVFTYAKPIELIKDLVFMSNFQKGIILDFFAGSGTTLHATMQLNKEDGGKRTCILCTNNENNICEDVTYERNKRVIKGYTKPNGEKVEGLKDNNLRYYRTEFTRREPSNKNRRELMYKSTPLLNIKEDLYTEKSKFGRINLNPKGVRYFEDDKKKMLVIYRPEFIPYFVEEIDKMEIEKPILIYVYSPGKYAFDDEFEIVAEKVQLCALPQAIIDAMSRVLPEKKEEELIPDLEIKTINGSEEIDLFANLKED